MVNGNETVKITEEEEQQALEDLKNEVSDAENLRELTNEVSDTENTEVKKSKRGWTDGLFGIWGKRSNNLATKKIKRRYVVMTPHQYHGKFLFLQNMGVMERPTHPPPTKSTGPFEVGFR